MPCWGTHGWKWSAAIDAAEAVLLGVHGVADDLLRPELLEHRRVADLGSAMPGTLDGVSARTSTSSLYAHLARAAHPPYACGEPASRGAARPASIGREDDTGEAAVRGQPRAAGHARRAGRGPAGTGGRRPVGRDGRIRRRHHGRPLRGHVALRHARRRGSRHDRVRLRPTSSTTASGTPACSRGTSPRSMCSRAAGSRWGSAPGTSRWSTKRWAACSHRSGSASRAWRPSPAAAPAPRGSGVQARTGAAARSPADRGDVRAGLEVAATVGDTVALAGAMQLKGAEAGTLTIAAGPTPTRGSAVRACPRGPWTPSGTVRRAAAAGRPRQHRRRRRRGVGGGVAGAIRAADIVDSPFLLAATRADEAAAELLRRRDRWGITSWCTHAPSGPALAEVAAPSAARRAERVRRWPMTPAARSYSPTGTRAVSSCRRSRRAVAVTAPGLLVGATDWCTHPGGSTSRDQGTKNPDVDGVVALRPTSSSRTPRRTGGPTWTRCAPRGPGWVTDVRTLDAAFGVAASGCSPPAARTPAGWGARAAWADAAASRAGRAVVPIWRRPWMARLRHVHRDVLERLGVDNAWAASPERYPRIDLADLPPVDLVVLPDEPYRFTADDGPEAFPGVPAYSCRADTSPGTARRWSRLRRAARRPRPPPPARIILEFGGIKELVALMTRRIPSSRGGEALLAAPAQLALADGAPGRRGRRTARTTAATRRSGSPVPCRRSRR